GGGGGGHARHAPAGGGVARGRPAAHAGRAPSRGRDRQRERPSDRPARPRRRRRRGARPRVGDWRAERRRQDRLKSARFALAKSSSGRHGGPPRARDRGTTGRSSRSSDRVAEDRPFDERATPSGG